MLTDRERNEIEEHLALYAHKRAGCIEAMMTVQRYRGWVSDEAVDDLAELLEMTAEELDGVATFHNLIFRQPVGRHVILICDSVSCWIMGYDNLLDHLHSRLGIDLKETTADGCFTLLPSVCLGACDRAPVMMIDGALFGDLTKERIDEILAGYE